MLARPAARAARRKGMTLVESVLVMTVFLMLLFGMFEYCRFLLVLHVTNNAARDGARYAAVRVSTDITQVAAVRQDVVNYTTHRMGGVQKNIEGFRVAVFAVDPAGLDLTPPVVRPKTRTTGVFPDPFNPNDPNAFSWNTAAYPERVAVTIDGTYRPILPAFLFMPSTIPINVTSHMASEG
jgi:Flp pilus assembly protein TadG